MSKELKEHHKYNKYLIHKHGSEGAKQLKEKGLLDYSQLLNQVEMSKVHDYHLRSMSFESGNTDMHPEITLMDQIDLQ